MKGALALFFAFLALGALFFAIDLAWQSAASGAPPLHPGQAQHHRYVMRLCDRGEVTFTGLPKGNVLVTVGAWVNGVSITTGMRGQTLWFYGSGVSGRMNVLHGTTLRVQAARFAPGCVRFVVAWWPR